jgi:peptidyl-prolyl cis-trans isomerase A (cyclophilin A)
MFKKILLTACTVLLSGALMAAENPRVVLETNLGNVEIELLADQAPISTQNFLAYVDSGFYDGTVFHRVIPDFMVQGGGFTKDMQQKDTQAPIRNEADNGLRNVRGTLSMARTQAKDSATSQFFINSKDNAFLDHGARDFGYAVFAKVTKGMEVVDRISGVPTSNRGMMQNVPREPVVIEHAKRL